MTTLSLLPLWFALASAAYAQDDVQPPTDATEPSAPAADAPAPQPEPPASSWPAASAPALDGVPEALILPETRKWPGRECRRQIGVSAGVVFPRDGWDLIGDAPIPTGSPILSLTCNLGGPVRPFASMSTAPLQPHWYRELGKAGLFVIPAFGILAGNGPVRFGLYTVMMPRLIGIGGSVELKFKGTEGNWLTHTSKGDGKGVELRFQVLDGDLVQYQLALMYTFGVNSP